MQPFPQRHGHKQSPDRDLSNVAGEQCNRARKHVGPALLLVPWLPLLDTEDDALGDLGHLTLAVLDCQFGAETRSSQRRSDGMDVAVPPEDYTPHPKTCVMRLVTSRGGKSCRSVHSASKNGGEMVGRVD